MPPPEDDTAARSPHERRFDAIVIGSGIGGLSAAVTLANEGYSVAVFEAAKQFGGLLNPFSRGKYRFDPAVHYLGECGPGQLFDRLLRELGVHGDVAFREIEPNGFDRLVFPDREIAVPRGVERFFALLAQNFPAERDGLERFFALLAELHLAAPATLAPREWGLSMPSPRDIPRLLRSHRGTFAAVLDEHFRDPLLKAVLAGQSGDYALPPSRASAMIALGMIDHYLGGAWSIAGGSGALRDVLVARLRAKSAALFRQSPVRSIEVDDRRVVGVRCQDGSLVRAGIVISNADSTTTYHSLIARDAIGPLARRRVPALVPSLSAVSVFIGARLDLHGTDLTDANVWHHADVDVEGRYQAIANGSLPFQSSSEFFLTSQSRKDSHAAGVLPHTFQVTSLCTESAFARWRDTVAPRRDEEYESLKRALAASALDCAERYVPGIARRADVVEVATPLSHARFVNAPRGALYGPEQTPEQVANRPSVRGLVTGLFLCGSSVAGGGVVSCALSGNAAGLEARAWLRSG